MASPGGQSGTTYNWPNLEPMQVEFYLAGEITQVIDSIPVVPLAMFLLHFWELGTCQPLILGIFQDLGIQSDTPLVGTNSQCFWRLLIY